MNESIVTKTTITLPVNGGALEAVSTIETVPYWTRSRKSGNLLFKTNKQTNKTHLFYKPHHTIFALACVLYSCPNMG